MKSCRVNNKTYILEMGWWLEDKEVYINPLLTDGVVYDEDILIPNELSIKEIEQLNHHLNATSYNDIADIMSVSLPTVKLRAKIILEKHNYIAKNIHELVVIYYKHKMRTK